jgi:hypothetical protein
MSSISNCKTDGSLTTEEITSKTKKAMYEVHTWLFFVLT